MLTRYYTVYYGFKKYEFASRLSLRKASRAAKVPLSNIEVGVRYTAGKSITLQAWQPPNKACSRLLLLVGKIIRFGVNRKSG